MLKQFRASYPQGSLISELVTIDRGKYLVRTLVKVAGTTLATGLAAADTVEQAEDRSRERALIALSLSALPMPSENYQQQVKSSNADLDANTAKPFILDLESANGESKRSSKQLHKSHDQSASSLPETADEEVALPQGLDAANPSPVSRQGNVHRHRADEVGEDGSFNTEVPNLNSGLSTGSVPASAQVQEPMRLNAPDSLPEQQPVQNSVGNHPPQSFEPSFQEETEKSQPVTGTQSSELAWATSDRDEDIGTTEPTVTPAPENQSSATDSSGHSFGLGHPVHRFETTVGGAQGPELISGADRAGTPPTTSPNLGRDHSRSVSVGHSFPPQNWGGAGRGGSQAAPLRGDDSLPVGDLHSVSQERSSESSVESGSWVSPVQPPADTSSEVKAEMPTPLSGPIDFSDIIAKTNVEMKRLGWTSEQGRKYLLETYGKRSRQLLSDEELLDFLHHLESLSVS